MGQASYSNAATQFIAAAATGSKGSSVRKHLPDDKICPECGGYMYLGTEKTWVCVACGHEEEDILTP